MLTVNDRRELIQDYYRTAEMQVTDLPRRELAVMGLDGRILRHQQKDTHEELTTWLIQQAPKAFYASLAVYLDPENKSNKFDERKTTICQECGQSWKLQEGKRVDNEACPNCKTRNASGITSTKDFKGQDLAFDIDYGDIPGADKRSPSENLGAASLSTFNLFTILTEDLGISRDDILITFSGGKGFHVRVMNTGLRPLDEKARRSLIDYVSGYNFKLMDFVKEVANFQAKPSWHLKGFESGWGKRFNESVAYFVGLSTRDNDDFEKACTMYWPWFEDKDKYGTKKMQASMKLMAAFKKSCAENKGILTGGDLRKLEDTHAKRLLSLSLARSRLRYACFVDKRVTADKARILRVPGSLHGGKGMVCCVVPTVEHLKNLDWVLELQAEVLGDHEVHVSIKHVSNTYYGVFEPGEHRVPYHQAIAILCAQV